MVKAITLTILAVAFAVVTGILVGAGLDWLEVGHGLNPAIAFPTAFLQAAAAGQSAMLAANAFIDAVEEADYEEDFNITNGIYRK